MRISDWSSDVCSSDLGGRMRRRGDVDPATIGLVLEINGEAAALACSGAVLGHPARAVQMLVAWLHERGRILPAGRPKRFVQGNSGVVLSDHGSRRTIKQNISISKMLKLIFILL